LIDQTGIFEEDEFMSEKINLEYRPNNYFWACDSGILLSSEIKGAKRKSLYELSVFDEDSVKYDELLFKPSLNDDERKDIGRLNPSYLGGEFIPDKNINEIEIARITINSVTSDVTSVFASRKDDKIYYRVVDEYDGETLIEETETESTLPMTLEELTNFFLTTWPLMEVLEMNFEAINYDYYEVKMFVHDASSSFYPEFGRLVDLRIDEWLTSKGIALAE